MEQRQSDQFRHILDYLSIGVIILGATSHRVYFANPYVCRLLREAWGDQEIVGRVLDDILPETIRQEICPLLERVATTGKHIQQPEVPFEGFLEARGRTYWNVSIEPMDNAASTHEASLFITLEDVTNTVRSRLHINAIQRVSSAIGGPYTLPHVLDSILQAVQEMVGSTRCAIFLIDYPISGVEEPLMQQTPTPHTQFLLPRTATLATQKGMHLSAYSWRPHINEQILIGRVALERRPLIITDTRPYPDLNLPLLDDEGTPRRPGSVLCVPILEPSPSQETSKRSDQAFRRRTGTNTPTDALLGTIEVYHLRSRGFPAEEVQLLEQFAQQAGLAIQNARLFHRMEQWARVASRNAHQSLNIMRSIPDGVVIFDPRWRVADANPVARHLLGWADDVIGLPLNIVMARTPHLFPQAIMEATEPVVLLEQRAIQGHIDEFKMESAIGFTYIRCSYTPVRDEPGNIFAFIVTYHDVSEQVAARERIEAEVLERTAELAQRNEALQQAQLAQEIEQARLELLLERLPSGVMLVSAADRSITIINARAAHIFQRLGAYLEPADDPHSAAIMAIGMDSEQLLHAIVTYGPSGTVIPYNERPLQRALLQGEPNEAELHMYGSDGQIVYLLVNSAPVRAADGTITDAILVMHDITTIKTLESTREDFFTTMAHELKTPLANIRAHLSALLAHDLQWSAEEQQDFLYTADEQVERLVGMINHFLDASRVEAGALRLELEPIFLSEMLEDLQERLEALITSSKRTLQITLPPHVPAVLGDYELIMSVLTNLLSNAFRYAPEGDTVYLDVELLTSEQEAQPPAVIVHVTDHGPGMTAEQQANLFTRFSTFAAMSRPAQDRPWQPTAERRRGFARWSPATGLGLYISRGIIEAHGSTLMLQSSPGQGASFSFTLPVVKEQNVSSDLIRHDNSESDTSS